MRILRDFLIRRVDLRLEMDLLVDRDLTRFVDFLGILFLLEGGTIFDSCTENQKERGKGIYGKAVAWTE
jgi:hypothetical protein